MKEESEDKKVMAVSEKWRVKHEGRMQTVGICRGEKEVEKTEKEEGGKPTPLSTLGKINSLGSGWEW